METMEIEDSNEVRDGTILSVQLQNFFNHDNFEVKFKKRATFIVGLNGSGKSAIMAALVVGLGGRASDTYRGKNVQSFIKENTNSATIKIKIKNSGTRAFKHDVYGDQITIVKTISAAGTSVYKIGLASGQMISTSAKEINAIVVAHNIQVNNPVSVLSQELSREFAVAMTPRKLYNLFKRATNLDVTEDNYERTLDICKSAVAMWEKKRDYCNELKNEYNKWQKLYEQMQSRKQIEKELKTLKHELVWSEVAEDQSEVGIIREKCHEQQVKCEKIEHKLESMEENVVGAAIDGLKTQLDEAKRAKTELEQELRELEAGANGVRREGGADNAAISRQVELLNREKRKVRDYEQEIQNIESGEAATQRSELESIVAQSSSSAAEARLRYTTLQNDVQQATNNRIQAHEALERALRQRRSHADRLKQLQQELRELEARGADSLAVYGSYMSELCQRVEQAARRGHFSAPPLGPIGRYLKVKEQRWGGALEHIIGGSIRSFYVNNSEDSRKLFKIMDQVCPRGAKPSVTCSTFLNKIHNVSGSSVRAAPHRSALDALEVSDANVANFLIDNLGLERVLFVPEHEDAVSLADTQENVPPNCTKIVTLDGTEYYPAPHYRSYGGRAQAARYLHLSTAQRKQQLQVEIQETERNIQAPEALIAELKANFLQAQHIESEATHTLGVVLAAQHQCEAEERAARAALEQLRVPQHDLLDDELNVSKQRVQTLSEQLSKLTAKQESCKRKIEEFDTKMREVKAKLAEATERCRELSMAIGEEENKVERGAAERRSWQNRLNEERNKLQQAEDILASKEAAVTAKINSLQVPRVEHPRNKTVIMSLIEQKKKKVHSLVQTASREEVERQRDVAEQNYRRMQDLLGKLKVLIEKIETTADEHLKFCCELKKQIGRHLGMHFMATLVTRGFHGKAVFNHKEEKLDLEVSGREGRRDANSPESLSGGERSYTTVAFLAALWECIELPFFFLDEFDVFMDEVNRQLVMDFMLDVAKRLSGRQFVFLTPHGAQVDQKTAKLPIEIISLEAPERVR